MVVRLLYAILLGLVGAAVFHIAVLLLVPVYSERDAWSRLADFGQTFQVVPLDRPGQSSAFAKGANPLIATSACRFSLGTGVVHYFADGDVPFWSVSIYGRRGQNFYSFNDRTATDRKLDLVIASPVQMVELRKELPEEYSNSVFVETEEREGIIVARAFIPDRSWTELTEAFLSGAVCRQE